MLTPVPSVILCVAELLCFELLTALFGYIGYFIYLFIFLIPKIPA